jgi:leader peptidase (prepilin peptidase) / N-methyltransferase
MSLVILFILGLAVGSFINVLATRYEPDKFLFKKSSIGGRSKCNHCGSQLKWFELIPLFSFIIQSGRCRNCKARLSLQYPISELLSGLIFILVPYQLATYNLSTGGGSAFGGQLTILPYVLHLTSYVLVFLTLLLISLIDFRLNLIPDEANIFLVFLGFFLTATSYKLQATSSFLGSYSLLFGFQNNIWLNHLFALLVGALFFGLIILITRGRAMGMGDLKLAAALGFIFGWPDIILIITLAFIIGSIFGVGLMVLKKKNMKSFVPFGPFIALATAVVFFFGYQIMDWYFSLFRI